MELQLGVLYAIVFINLLGFGIMIPMLPYLAIRLHAHAFSLGMMTVSFSFAQMIGNMYLGMASDRLGCRMILLVCTCGSALSYFFIGIVEDMDLLILFRGGGGFFSGTVGVAQSFVSLIVPAEDRGEYLGYVEACIGAGFAVGPGLGGVLTKLMGFTGPCFAAAAMCMVVMGTGICFLKDPQRESAKADVERKESKKKPSQSLWSFLLEMPQCLCVMLSTTAYYAAFAAFEAMGALYFLSTFGISASEFGIICTLSGIGAVVVQRYFIKKILATLGEKRSGILGHAIRAVGYSIVAIFPYWWAPYLLGILIPGGSILAPASAALLSRLSPPELRGAVLGSNQSFASLGRVLGPMAASILYEFEPISLWYGAVGFSLLGVVTLLCVRDETQESSKSTLKELLLKTEAHSHDARTPPSPTPGPLGHQRRL